MTYRKTWFSYVLWVIYSILCVILLVQAGNVWVSYLAGIPYAKGFPDAVMAPLAGIPRAALPYLGLLVIPVTALLYWIVRVLAGIIRKKCIWKERVVRIVECLMVFITIAGGIFLRIDSARASISMLGNEQFLLNYVSGTEYYDLAVVTAEGTVPFMAYGAAYLYVMCLSVVLSFLGNKIASAVILQVFLQIGGLGFAYAVTRKLAGNLPAYIILLYLAYSPCCLRMLTQFSPEWFFFDLYMIGLLIIASFVKDYCANQFSRLMAVAGAVGAGVVIGILAYLDITAVTLLVVIVAAATGRKTIREGEPACSSLKMNAAVIATTVISCMAGWLSAAAIAAYANGTSLPDSVETWIALHIYDTQTFGYKILYPYIWDIYIIGIVVILAAFLVFEFFRNGREQNYMLWFLICALAAPTPLAVLGVHAYGIFSFYIWGVLAGLGLQNCIFGGKVQLMQEIIEEINSVTEDAVGAEDKIEIADAAIVREEGIGNRQDTQGFWATEDILEEPEPVSYEKLTVIQESKEASNQSEQPETFTLEWKDSKQPVAEECAIEEEPRFIENPLPLPKKHVKKEMDYQYLVTEENMKYDVEVPEDDDFDIQ